MFYVYTLYSSAANKYYVGQTEKVDKRLVEHSVRKNLGTNDWVLKYMETFRTRAESMKREREIKARKSRRYIELLIDSSA